MLAITLDGNSDSDKMGSMKTSEELIVWLRAKSEEEGNVAFNILHQASDRLEKLQSALLHIANMNHFPADPAKDSHDIITYAQDALKNDT